MRKILLLIPSLANAGGTERMVHALSGLFTRAGYQVHQASFDLPGTSRHFSGDTPFHGLGPVPRLPLPLRFMAYAMAARRLRRLEQQLGIDTTISNLWGADLVSALAGGGRQRIALCHTNIIGNRSNRLMLRLLPLVRALYRRFAKVVAVNEALAGELQQLYRLDVGRITHIDNFADRPDGAPIWRAGDCDGVRRFVWCGRFSHEKNVEGLLHVWARFSANKPRNQLVLIGDGPEQPEMRALASSLGLSVADDPGDTRAQLVFVGKQDEPAAFMAGGHALVLSSRVEGLPMVVLEALALGLPVLAADCPAGGVRTALIGQGHCDPDRDQTQVTPAGMLLPVPRQDEAATLALWEMALNTAATDKAQHDSWCQGALERARLFSSQAALGKWQALIDATGSGT